MSTSVLSKAAAGMRIVAALGCVALAGRFTWIAVDAALAEPPPPSAAGSAQPNTGPSGAPVAVRAAPSGAPVAHGALIRVTMMVNAGPDRSEVWMDETKLGQTPFIGDVECHAKEAMHVRVIPTKGNPIELSPVCTPGVVKVDQPK